ncbi:MAG: putative anti-sigma regulatory factor, serine/threonine protein kinase [Chloroflexi bacterium]|jgi:serine/threonine-protein kinase RsbW|nr:putative anti-sigma regulatory factor, serine/threonine protein kinase [Chloroflexota bacterium]
MTSKQGIDESIITPAFNDIDIQIPSDIVFERVVRESAVFVAKYLGFDEERVADLQLAVSEAVTNAIEHGNNSDINIKAGVKFFVKNGQLAVQVSDLGHWVDATAKVETAGDNLDIEERLERNFTRGMGIFLIEKLVDNIEVKSSSQGTEFTMWFNLNKNSQSQSPISFNIELQKAEQNLN